MKLYYSRGACSLAPHIVLREVGADFEAIRVDPRTKLTEMGGDFRAVNPNGYVPVLELDSGERLTEATAVLQYLADQYPQSGLAPARDTFAYYRLIEWLSFIATELHRSYGALFHPQTPAEYAEIARVQLAKRLAYVEGALQRTSYLLGETLSVADIYLFVALSWSRVTHVDLTAFAHIQEFQARVAHRPAVQAAMKVEGLIK